MNTESIAWTYLIVILLTIWALWKVCSCEEGRIEMEIKFIKVAGPFTTEKEAKDTADYLGSSNHCVFSQYVPDDEGYISASCAKEYFVERDTSTQSEQIFGRSWEEIQGMQQKRV